TRSGRGCGCALGCPRAGRAPPGTSTPTARWSTSRGCAWPGWVGACVTGPVRTSGRRRSRPAGGASSCGPRGGGSGPTARPSTSCSPTPRRATAATAPTRRTTASSACTTWSRRCARACSCTATSTPTASPCRTAGSATPASSTSWATRSWRSESMADTGFPRTDAEHDFLRARRKATLARLAARLRREPDDVSEILPFDEVVAALGRTGERRLGLQVIPLDSIVGSVDRTRDFDRWFRPRSGRSRERWERLATAHRRGESIPPIDVYRVGELHFVRDGHHRVSVAHALGLRTIDAYVTEVTTKIDATGISRRGDLISKDLRRVFLDRVPLPGPAL